MKVKFEGIGYVDLSRPLDISIPLKEGADNPNCYWADSVKFEVIRTGSFVGSVSEGGSVNYQKLIVTPHGNGTHTECYGHITSEKVFLNDCLNKFHFLCQLVSVKPETLQNGDKVITLKSIQSLIEDNIPQSLVIRTFPNESYKLVHQYSGTNPPFLEPLLTEYLSDKGVLHLLVDLPSIDKEEDEGKLLAHRAFWNYPQQPRKDATLTELVFVPNELSDGKYLLNLQITSLEMDASPSKPILYKIDKKNDKFV